MEPLTRVAPMQAMERFWEVSPAFEHREAILYPIHSYLQEKHHCSDPGTEIVKRCLQCAFAEKKTCN